MNFVVDGDSIVFRTSAYSALGTLAPGGDVAFEVDYLDNEMRQGWSVVATGRAKAIEEPAEIEMLRERGLEPSPWASGLRRLYIRLEWRDITGRAVGDT